jgi:hypothetical protein
VPGEHLTVACLAEHIAEPCELTGQPLRVAAADDLPERPAGRQKLRRI